MEEKLSTALQERSQGVCELCADEKAVSGFVVSPKEGGDPDNEVALCASCLKALSDPDSSQHWQCLAGAVWNTAPAVQALSYRILHGHQSHEWAREILSSINWDESIVEWAVSPSQAEVVHKDTDGTQLQQGDSVILTQALNVKGTSFSAAKGTVVKKIRLVSDNSEQIEGKINNQMIVLATKFVRKFS